MSNKRTTVLVLVLLAALLLTTITAAQRLGTVTITTDNVHVRFGPDTGYKIIGSVDEGAAFTVLGRDYTGNWVNIEYDSVPGWVNWNYVDWERAAIADLPISEVVPGRVTITNLNVRRLPDTASPIVEVITSGTIVEVLGRDDSNQWVYIQTPDGATGWVVRAFLNVASDNYMLRIPLLSSIPGVGANVNPPTSGGDIEINRDFVRVRFGPDTGYRIIGYVHAGETYDVLGRDVTGFWLEIVYRGMAGWINWNYADLTRDEILDLPVTELVPGRVVPDTLNVRSEPLYDAPVITQVERGTMVVLIGRDVGSEWVLAVLPDGTTGWVNRFYLNIGAEEYFLRIPLID